MKIHELLTQAVEAKASDLHISTGQPPMIRINGDLIPTHHPVLDAETTLALIHETMEQAQLDDYQDHLETDYSYAISGIARFRVNAFHQNRGPAAVFRTIPEMILTLDDLITPPIFQEITTYPRGLVLVTGPTGSGKSTTLAAMIDHINRNRSGHIITIEDPIEFVHKSQRCLINQREVKRDTLSFQNALRSALREDPDYILVGEMRDIETIRLALTAAETGHLVFATLHTTSAAKTIDRIIDVFPAGEKDVVRTMLSESLQAVIAQTLLKHQRGGRIAAHEVLVATPAIRNLIREDKVAQIYSVLQTGQEKGMQTLEQSLQRLLKQGVISHEEATRVSSNRELL